MGFGLLFTTTGYSKYIENRINLVRQELGKMYRFKELNLKNLI